jgi:hypothetical protein
LGGAERDCFWIAVIVITTIAVFDSRRACERRVLRKEVADAELTSINLWMQVEDAEENKREASSPGT